MGLNFNTGPSWEDDSLNQIQFNESYDDNEFFALICQISEISKGANMITEEQYNEAIIQKDEAQNSINQYHKEQKELFDNRMKNNPVFTEDELRYSAFSLCPCGHGLAYPKGCSPHHYWDCSAILKGIADEKISHTDKLPFMYYSIRGENEKETTRGVFKPQVKDQ